MLWALKFAWEWLRRLLRVPLVVVFDGVRVREIGDETEGDHQTWGDEGEWEDQC